MNARCEVQLPFGKAVGRDIKSRGCGSPALRWRLLFIRSQMSTKLGHLNQLGTRLTGRAGSGEGLFGTSGRGVGSERRSHHRRGCRAASRGSGCRDPAVIFEFSSVPGPQCHAPLSDGAASCSNASRAQQWGNPLLRAPVFLAYHLVVRHQYRCSIQRLTPHHGSRSRSQIHFPVGRMEHRRSVQPPAAAVHRRAAEPARGTRQQRIRG